MRTQRLQRHLYKTIDNRRKFLCKKHGLRTRYEMWSQIKPPVALKTLGPRCAEPFGGRSPTTADHIVSSQLYFISPWSWSTRQGANRRRSAAAAAEREHKECDHIAYHLTNRAALSMVPLPRHLTVTAVAANVCRSTFTRLRDQKGERDSWLFSSNSM